MPSYFIEEHKLVSFKMNLFIIFCLKFLYFGITSLQVLLAGDVVSAVKAERYQTLESLACSFLYVYSHTCRTGGQKQIRGFPLHRTRMICGISSTRILKSWDSLTTV